MIGIRLADHSVFPVFASDVSEGKRVVLTTAHDNQERVDIELVRADDDESLSGQPLPIGRVSLRDLPAGPSGAAEVEVVLQLSPTGLLDVFATDRATGNARSVSIDVDQTAGETAFAMPARTPELATEGGVKPRSRRSGWLVVGGIMLISAVLAGGAWWLMVRSPAEEPLDGEPPHSETVAETAESVPSPAALPSVDSAIEGDSIEYRIRRGDTLWDISETFYGTPWLFSELADANKISNPNLIYADSELEIPEQLLRRDN